MDVVLGHLVPSIYCGELSGKGLQPCESGWPKSVSAKRVFC